MVNHGSLLKTNKSPFRGVFYYALMVLVLSQVIIASSQYAYRSNAYEHYGHNDSSPANAKSQFPSFSSLQHKFSSLVPKTTPDRVSTDSFQLRQAKAARLSARWNAARIVGTLIGAIFGIYLFMVGLWGKTFSIMQTIHFFLAVCTLGYYYANQDSVKMELSNALKPDSELLESFENGEFSSDPNPL